MAKHLKETPQTTGAPKTGAKPRRRGLLLPIALFAVAVVLLLTSAAGSAQAALTYFSEQYDARLALPQIGITLTENGQAVDTRDYSGADDKWVTAGSKKLLESMVPQGEKLQLGKEYDEALAVANSGSIDEYVRVKVYRYWLDAQGNRMTALSPDLIKLNWANQGAWAEDVSARTAERNIFYYTGVLAPGATTEALTDKIAISGDLATKVTQTEERDEKTGLTTITTVYAYDGVQFVVEAEADAVQTHNAQDAIKSAWGVNVSIGADGSLSLA